MRKSGLRGRQKRGFQPASDRLGQLWQSDITYIETQEGWLYLAFTLDGCSHRCIAHHCRGDMLAELTTTTFKHAVTRQRPLAGLIHQSDRGSQYAAGAFQHCLRAWGVTPSMSRKGIPYDNALAESFVATLKTECFGKRGVALRHHRGAASRRGAVSLKELARLRRGGLEPTLNPVAAVSALNKERALQAARLKK